jgi:hypothetical protein
MDRLDQVQGVDLWHGRLTNTILPGSPRQPSGSPYCELGEGALSVMYITDSGEELNFYVYVLGR